MFKNTTSIKQTWIAAKISFKVFIGKQLCCFFFCNNNNNNKIVHFISQFQTENYIQAARKLENFVYKNVALFRDSWSNLIAQMEVFPVVRKQMNSPDCVETLSWYDHLQHSFRIVLKFKKKKKVK